MRKYREYTDDDIVNYAKEVTSTSQLLEKLNLKKAGGNFDSIKRKLQKLNVDTSHWTGQAWSKDIRLKDWSDYSRGNRVKPHLIKIRGYKCENCLMSEWMSSPIPLEIDHIDGNRTNNSESNLKLLCCNCHALTPTWRGRKNSVSDGT